MIIMETTPFYKKRLPMSPKCQDYHRYKISSLCSPAREMVLYVEIKGVIRDLHFSIF